MKKVTFLTGAGFNVPLMYGGISTQGLTDAMCQANPFNSKYAIDGMAPGEYFRNILNAYYDGKMSTAPTLSEVNFETIAYLVEELFAFYYDKGDHTPGNPKGISGSYLEIVQIVDKDIQNASKVLNVEPSVFLRNVYNVLIEPIINIVGELDQNPNQQGMLDFQTNMLDGIFTGWKQRIYTLNYDTWIAQNCGFFDGFDEGVFAAERVYSDLDCNCHYNLHGSVRWRPDLDKERIEKLESIVNVHGYITSNIQKINRQRLIPSPIITGYNKSERLARKPYIALHHAFLRDMLDSDFLVVIGYGGGDPHVNEILSTYRGKVVVIDFFSDWVNSLINQELIDPLDSDGSRKLEYDINPFGNGWADEMQWGVEPLVRSNDGLVSVYWRGITPELYEVLPTLLRDLK
jgi:hypothetical protein